MKLVVVNYAFDPRLESAAKLLRTYRSLSGWCNAAAGAGLSVRLVQAFTEDAVIRGEGVEYLFCKVPAPRSLRIRQMHAFVAAFDPDIVHVNGLDSPVHTWLLRRRLPATTAIVVQDHAGTPPRSRVKATVRRSLMRAPDGYLFTSIRQGDPWVQGDYIEPTAVYDVTTASTAMIPVHRDAARQRTGFSGGPALLWVARLDANKDPLTVLDGFEIAASHLPDASLTMVYQGGPLLSAVQARISTSSTLARCVHLVGAVPHEELAAWYSAADVFVLGSEQEVCGYALIEACACGAVPVVTDIPSFRAITANGAVGRLWRRGDAESFADAVVAVSRRLPEERVRVLGHFAERLSWRAVGQRARAVYEAVVAGRRSAGRREGA